MLTIEERKQRKAEYMKEYSKEYYQKNKERILEYKKEYWKDYYQKNKEAIAEHGKEYREKNKEARKEYVKEYYQKNREIILLKKKKRDKINKEVAKEYRKKNRERMLERAKEYYQKNKEARKVYFREYSRNRYHTDLRFKMSRILRRTLHEKLSKHLIKETNPEFSYTETFSSFLGCTLEELKTHIENQFEDGMTWENWTYDGWHLDHIVPCSSFDLTKEKEQEKCFHYKNLQPLWAEDNLSKSNKLNWSREELVV